MRLIADKLGGALVLLTSALLLGLLPFRLVEWLRLHSSSGSRRWVELLLSCVQCFGAGILMATVFAHMLPEVRASLEATLPASDFPAAETLLCAGLFSIYTVEELVEAALQRIGRTAFTRQRDGQPQADVLPSKRDYGSLDAPADAILDHQGHAHVPDADGGGLTGFRVFVVAVALSVHSVLEGVAVGLEARAAGVWMLVAAIGTHKCIIAFCLGEQLAASGRRLRAALATLLVFVAASPCGVLVGMLVDGGGGTESPHALLADVLKALAAGSILYVVFFEIIQGERAKAGSGLAKLAAVLVGFGFMLMVTSLVRLAADPRPTPAVTHVTSVTAAAPT